MAVNSAPNWSARTRSWAAAVPSSVDLPTFAHRKHIRKHTYARHIYIPPGRGPWHHRWTEVWPWHKFYWFESPLHWSWIGELVKYPPTGWSGITAPVNRRYLCWLLGNPCAVPKYMPQVDEPFVLPTCFAYLFSLAVPFFYLFFFLLSLFSSLAFLDTSWLLCFVWMILTSCGPHLTYNFQLHLHISTSMYSWSWACMKHMPWHLTYDQVHPFHVFNLDNNCRLSSLPIFQTRS